MQDLGSSPVPLDDLWATYRTARAPERLAPITWVRYENEYALVAGELARSLGRSPTAADLTLPNLRTAFAGYATTPTNRGEPRSRSTIAGCMSTWSSFLSFLVADEALPGNPMAGMPRPKIPKSTPKALKGEDTVERLLESAARGDRNARRPWPARDLAVLVGYLSTGLRQQELAGLDVADMDGPDGAVRWRVRGKGSKERWVPVEPELVAVVEAFQRSRRERFDLRRLKATDPLFCNDDGGRLTPANLRWIVTACLAAAGLGNAPPKNALVHALRHTFATMLANQGATATDLQKILGHGSLSTSQRYIDATDERVREVAQKAPGLEFVRRRAELASVSGD
jgi:site-specific recombinase XerD